ncbi:mCG148047 [Mus musculus]|nr:mCG148047 [Mus musculus]
MVCTVVCPHVRVVFLLRRWRYGADWSFSSSQPLYAPANYHAHSSLPRPTPRGVLPQTTHILKPRIPPTLLCRDVASNKPAASCSLELRECPTKTHFPENEEDSTAAEEARDPCRDPLMAGSLKQSPVCY